MNAVKSKIRRKNRQVYTVAFRMLIMALVASVCLITPAKPVLAIANPNSITLHTVKVFQNVFEASDILFVASYDVYYASEPTEEAEDAFSFNILTSGGSLLGTRPLEYYQYNLTSIYYDATAATALTWGTEYTARVTGNPALFSTLTEGTNMASIILSDATNWIEGTESETEDLLYAHCIDIAEALEDDWSTTLIVQSAAGKVLNTTGRTTFLDAIPALDVAVPALFQLAVGTFEIERDTGTGAYDTTLSMSSKAGSAIASAFNGVGSYFGTTGQTMGGLFITLIAMIVAGFVFFYTGNTIAAMVLAVPMVVMGNWMGLVPLVITFIAAMVLVTYMAYHLYLRGI